MAMFGMARRGWARITSISGHGLVMQGVAGPCGAWLRQGEARNLFFKGRAMLGEVGHGEAG